MMNFQVLCSSTNGTHRQGVHMVRACIFADRDLINWSKEFQLYFPSREKSGIPSHEGYIVFNS